MIPIQARRKAKECLTSAKFYLLNRIDSFYEEQKVLTNLQSYSIKKIISAIMATEENNLFDIDRRLHAIVNSLTNKKSQLDYLIAANKRLKNILSKSCIDNITTDIDLTLIKSPEESDLVTEIEKIESEMNVHLTKKSYTEAIDLLVRLCPAISNFFDSVMVNTEDTQIKNNRLTILYKLQQKFLFIADLSLIN